MSTQRSLSSKHPETTLEILERTAQKYQFLDDRFDIHLRNQDATRSQLVLEQRARMILTLPDRLIDAVPLENEKMREDVDDLAESFSLMAAKALKRGGFALTVLLVPREGIYPTYLHRLVEEIKAGKTPFDKD